MLSPLTPVPTAVRGCCLPRHINTRTCNYLNPNTNHILTPRTKHDQTTYKKDLSFTSYPSTSKSTTETLTVLTTHGIATVERQHRYCTALTLTSCFSPREDVSHTINTNITLQSKNHGTNYVSRIRYVDDPKELPTGPSHHKSPCCHENLARSTGCDWPRSILRPTFRQSLPLLWYTSSLWRREAHSSGQSRHSSTSITISEQTLKPGC